MAPEVHGCDVAVTPMRNPLPLSSLRARSAPAKRLPFISLISSQPHRSVPMNLRRNEYCPIHRSRFCCGREQRRKERCLRTGVQRIEDPQHPRGYRELRSPAEMRKLLNRKIAQQDRKCAICHQEFTDYGDVVPDHIEPKGMGGARRDDHPENIQAAHRWCNSAKGSTRLPSQEANGLG